MVTGTRRFDKSWLILTLIVLVAIGAGIILFIQLRIDKISEDIKEGRGINIAFFVTDQETLLFTELFLFDPVTGKAALFDIPGHWGDVIESLERVDRIDFLYDPSNPTEYREKISSLLEINIPYHFEMDLQGVEKLVDLLEGLEMFIANPVELIEEDRLVLLPSGSLILDGRKIRVFISYSISDESDIERRARHQKFIQAFLRGIAEYSEILQRDDVYPFLRGNINTNIGKRALLALIEHMPKLDLEHIVPKAVHGDEVSVDGQIILFPHFEGELIRESVRQTVQSLANTEILTVEEQTVVVEILNGTPRAGLAARTAHLFANFGYDIAPVENADRDDYENTTIISRRDNMATAQRIAGIINCTSVRSEPSSPDAISQELASSAVDVTIILGMDFDGRYCKE